MKHAKSFYRLNRGTCKIFIILAIIGCFTVNAIAKDREVKAHMKTINQI